MLQNILLLRKKYSKEYQRVWFDTPILRQPHWQHIGLLDSSFNHYFEEAIEFMEEHQHSSDMIAFRDYEIAKLKRTYQVMQQGIADRNKQLANFWKFFASHDVRRDTSIIETFPEYADFFKECRNA